MKLALVLFAFIFTQVSCSNLKLLDDSKCTKTNWTTYGEEVAARGLGPEDDQLVKKCRGENLNMDEIAYELSYARGLKKYCTSDTVFAVGKKGEDFNFPLCKFKNEDDMRVKHSNGVVVYCSGDKAYKRGFAGEPLNQICPKNLLVGYKKSFYKGRKKYLLAQISTEQRKLDKIDHDKSNLRLNQNKLVTQLQGNYPLSWGEKKKHSAQVDQLEKDINLLDYKKFKSLERIKELEQELITANKY